MHDGVYFYQVFTLDALKAITDINLGKYYKVLLGLVYGVGKTL